MPQPQETKEEKIRRELAEKLPAKLAARTRHLPPRVPKTQEELDEIARKDRERS